MTLLHRHMLKEILLAVLMAAGGFLFIMVAANLLKGPLALVLDGRLPWPTFFELTFLLIPGVAPYVMPIGILTGVLLVLGRMSAQNEITAMRAAGMSLRRIAAPIVAIGLAGTALAVFVNFQYAPWANDRTKAILEGAVRDNPINFIAEKTPVSDFKDHLIYADKRDGDTLSGVWIWRREKAPKGALGAERELIRADHARLTHETGDPDDPDDDLLVLNLRGAAVERREPAAPGEPDALAMGGAEEATLRFPLGKLLKDSGGYSKKLRWHTFTELMALREKGYRLKPGASAKERFADRIEVQLQIQTNLASAFGILSLTLLAIPLGIRVSRSETFVNFGVALALALSYYLLTVVVSWIQNPALRPDLLVWLPNLLIQAVAIKLFLKAEKL